MAPNKFATMLNRKTNRITLVLVYAVLEWTLIFFLLLNSLFSYLIFKFANYFGLKPPCLLCSRLDHIFEPHNSNSSYINLICEHHAVELSRSGYCFNHRKLVESQDMCVDCKVVEGCDVNLRCSCCRGHIKSEILVPRPVIKPSSGVLEDAQKASTDELLQDVDFDVILEDTQKANTDELLHDVIFDREPDQNGIDSLGTEGKDKEGVVDLVREDDDLEGFSFCLSKEGYSLVEADEDEGDVVLEAETEPLLKGSSAFVRYSYADEKILPQHLEFYIDLDDYQLIPVEVTDLEEIAKSKDESQDDGEEDQKMMDQGKLNELWRETEDGLVLDVVEKLNSSSFYLLELDETNKFEDLPTKQGQEQELVREIDIGVEPNEGKVKDLPSEKGQEEEEEIRSEVSAVVVLDEDKVEILPAIDGQVEVETKEIDFHVAGDQEHDDQVTELNSNIPTSDFGDVRHKENDEIDVVSSVESIDKCEVAEPLGPCEDECPSINDFIFEDSICSNGLLEEGDYEPKKTEETQSKGDYEPMQTEEIQNYKDMTVEISEPELQSDMALSHGPNPVESLYHLHKEIPFLRRMGSADAEILDGSTANELKSGEEVVTVEELKSLLESERNTLRELYAELDEERNAAAIATIQTMSMINRLQEEKATIEMEALQYQRMMEEQSEYDQEALQLLNEMLVKREKELQELEKELEACRKKVMEYEERERLRLLSQRKDRLSASCSNEEESDGLSVDLNSESREEEESGHHDNTPVDAILDLQDPLSSFEEERISILEQLKVLEEKLCNLAEEEECHVENMKPFEQFYEENAKEFDRSFKINGDTNGKHHQEKRINGSKPKQLLPLFDAAEIDSDDELSNGVEDRFDPPLATHKPLPTKFDLEKKRLAIEDEVDHVYERLHALEADGEFVKHCVGSLRKGDKGVHLLQEILEHLRDLKNIELQAKNVYGVC